MTIPTGRGVTLWGGGGGEEDRVLVVAGHIHLFRKEASLREFVRHRRRCNLTGTSGYGRLRKDSASAFMAAWVPAKKYDLVTIGRWLEAPRWDWSLARCSEVQDGLNLLWDMAQSLGQAAWVEQLRRGTSPLGTFMDELNFLDERERHDTLSRWEGSTVRDAYAEILRPLSSRCVIED